MGLEAGGLDQSLVMSRRRYYRQGKGSYPYRHRTQAAYFNFVSSMTAFKKIGSTALHPTHRASCHCGRVVFELDLPHGVLDPRRCDCSICRQRGAIASSVPLNSLRIVQGEDSLRLYQFGTMTAKHYFCGNCGIYTHHQRRSDPNVYSFNIACLEGVNPFDLGAVPTSNGINHVSDRKDSGAA
jgi:hypothetical protein